MTKIDIVVPCYNYGRFLDACLNSILSQSIRDFRVLIIDDASSDDSLSVANRIAITDPRVSVISHAQNLGHIHTYNQGIEWASADYFMILSADDMLVPGAFCRAIKIMDDNPDIVLTHGIAVVWVDALEPPQISEQRLFGWGRQSLIEETCALGCNLVHTPTAIVRTSTQKSVGGYRPTLPHSGDVEMWLRFAAHGSIAKIDAVQAIYRRHSTNMSNSYFAKKLPDFEERAKVFDSFFRECCSNICNAETLKCLANRVLSEKVYISGLARMCRGDVRTGLKLLRYSVTLNSRLRYLPPIALLIKLKLPGLSKLAVSLGFWGTEALLMSRAAGEYAHRPYRP